MASVSTGNGAPSGEHFNLNIIAVSQPKSEDMDAAGGHVIFVKLGKKDGAAVTTKIMLEQSASAGEFAVLDKNGTDGEAKFSLPAPGSYSIWVRPLGKPGGESISIRCSMPRRSKRAAARRSVSSTPASKGTSGSTTTAG